MTAAPVSIIQLECDCNNYPWGKPGSSSLAARYASATPSSTFKLDESKNYSEMWMGTYPTLPALLLSTGEDLQEHLNANKQLLIGKKVLDKFGTDLPFLPKILSIAKALPLQIHPNKELARKLHENDSEKFGDANHKPEIAITLSETFEAFVGFKPLEDVDRLFNTISGLKEMRPADVFTDASLKEVVSKLLKLDEKATKELYNKLVASRDEFQDKEKYIPDLLPRLADQYGPTDPGSLVAVLTMNFLVLKKGEAIYIPADGIHAYLSGDIVEVMARSDNVINSGFCPRADRDNLDLFTESVTYNYKSPEQALLKPRQAKEGLKGKSVVYDPPMSEFKVLKTTLGAGEEEEVSARDGPGTLVCTGGSGRIHGNGQDLVVAEGYVFFIGAGTQLKFVADNEGRGLELHYTYCEV